MHQYILQAPIPGEYISTPLWVNRPKRWIVMLTVLLSSYVLLGDWQHAFESQQAGEKRAITVYLLAGGIVALVITGGVIALIVVRLKSAQRRKALEQIIERYRQSALALVRYVMLKHQCPEEAAYQRIASFVKSHVPVEEHSSIDNLLAHDRQGLLDWALSILASDPDEIDKI
jgi:hypothetical protein